MKLWIGAETQADVVDLFRPIRGDVERAVNSAIQSLADDIGVDAWDCIVILRDDSSMEEVLKFSKKKRSMDFRLRMDYQAFVEANEVGRRLLLLNLLLRSLSLLKEKSGKDKATDELMYRIEKIEMNP